MIGTLLPFNSLYSKQFGDNYFENAKLFVKWLNETGQSIWQTLPLQPTEWKLNNFHKFSSPYSSYGFGLNPDLFLDAKIDKYLVSLEQFVSDNGFWLKELCLYLALSEKFETDYWPNWPGEYRDNVEENIDKWCSQNLERYNFYLEHQYRLHNYFWVIRDFAKALGVDIWGDIPFYIPLNSPIVWRNRECFLLSAEGKAEYMSGALGGKHFGRQAWFHPLYNWDSNFEGTIGIWKQRLKYMSRLFDSIRIDSAIRFYIYAKLHFKDPFLDLVEEAPGDRAFFEIVNFSRECNLKIFAEDLAGFDMTKLHSAMERLEIPGISVFSQSMTKGERSFDAIHFNLEKIHDEHIFYSSTHDSITLLEFIETLQQDQRDYINRELSLDKKTFSPEYEKEILNFFLKEAKIFVAPIQDWVGTRDRINIPGTISDENWNYKMTVPIEELPLKLY